MKDIKMETIETSAEFDLASHRAETKRLWAEMDLCTDNLTVPHTADLNMDLTIQLMGNSVIVFCNGGESEYFTLLNHGLNGVKDLQRVGPDDSIPYVSTSRYKFLKVLASIAENRVTLWAMSAMRKGKFRKCIIRHRKAIVEKLVAAWFNAIPSEENPMYSRQIAFNDICAEMGGDLN